MNNYRLIISGYSGFVGTNLLSYLKVNGCDNILELDRKDLAEIESLDFRDGDVVIHLAGKAHDLKKVSDPDEYYTINYEITKRLYDAFIGSKAKKFIFMSSVKASADTVEGILTEDSIAAPETHYGKSKLLAEEYIRSQPLPSGKSYYILRPCMIHGPGNKGNLNLLYKFIQKGIPYPLASFDNQRSYLSIQNLCFIIRELIIQESVACGVYNVADDQTLSTSEVIKVLSASLDRDGKLWKISPKVITLLAKIGDKFHLPLTTERLLKLTENYVVSTNKIKKAINRPMPVSAVEGLKITAFSFQNPSV